MTRWFDHLLAGLDENITRATPAKIRAFEIVLVLLCVTELWGRELEERQLGLAYSWQLPIFVTACGVAACTAAWRQLGFLFLGLGMAVATWQAFPSSGNHLYLECFLCALCALLDSRQKEEQRLMIRSLRWMACVIMLFAGIQKLAHGYYTTGLMPAFLLQEPRFQAIFSLLLPTGDAQRILAYSGLDGAGPYFVSAPLWLLASNLIWALEIALAITLFLPKTRHLAVWVGIVFVALIEVGAREISFGLLFVGLLLVFLPDDTNRRFVPIVALTCAVLIMVRLGWLPPMEIH